MKTGKLPKRCIDAVFKYCQGCKYGVIVYPEWVETHEDLEGCCFETYCSLGLENTEPTKREIAHVKRYFRKIDRQRKRERERELKLKTKIEKNYNKF